MEEKWSWLSRTKVGAPRKVGEERCRGWEEIAIQVL